MTYYVNQGFILPGLNQIWKSIEERLIDLAITPTDLAAIKHEIRLRDEIHSKMFAMGRVLCQISSRVAR